jgi:hypothetical protein
MHIQTIRHAIDRKGECYVRRQKISAEVFNRVFTQNACEGRAAYFAEFPIGWYMDPRTGCTCLRYLKKSVRLPCTHIYKSCGGDGMFYPNIHCAEWGSDGVVRPGPQHSSYNKDGQKGEHKRAANAGRGRGGTRFNHKVYHTSSLSLERGDFPCKWGPVVE